MERAMLLWPPRLLGVSDPHLTLAMCLWAPCLLTSDLPTSCLPLLQKREFPYNLEERLFGRPLNIPEVGGHLVEGHTTLVEDTPHTDLVEGTPWLSTAPTSFATLACQLDSLQRSVPPR